MNELNKLNVYNSNEWKKSWKNLKYALMLTSLLWISAWTEALAQSQDRSIDKTEISTDQFMNILNQRLWVKLLSLYDTKVRNFMESNPVMRDRDTREFTMNFIVDQMKLNRWVDKSSQLLFIRDAIYSQVIWKDLYDWEDWNEKLLEDYEKSVDMAETCGKKYSNELNLYLLRITEESSRRTEESNRRTEAMIANIMSQDSAWLKNLIEIYDLYKKDNNSVTSWEIEKLKAMASHIISDCKKYWIDYKKILPEEVRRFYWIE